ncbi:esterase-like activity of phytase family protein [Beijerinckia mobilis]|uniref:esterase-like activity of phytase family protein n=1 Tax=Beijerinckia mobilis TaxID=231434 RepID=UPI00069031A5|nr:esterase-like activity of phytase family protein [Beijerinckia mobilis]
MAGLAAQTRFWRLRAYSATGIASVLTVFASLATASAQSITFEGQTFVNKGLVGVTRIPSNAVDQFGDTLGGMGSGMAMDPLAWHKKGDGSFAGTVYMLPDRGWNTQGTVDFQGRLHKFEFTLQPFTGTSTTAQNQLVLDYKGSIKFSKPFGTKTTGLDPTGIFPASTTFPELPKANNSIPVDNEAVVYPGDGTVWISDEYGPYVYHYTLDGHLLEAIRPPEAFIPKRKDASGAAVDNFSANSPPVGVTYDPSPGNPVSGRQNNQGFEGLAMSPDRSKLYVLLQSALIQDLDPNNIKTTRRNTRLLVYDLEHRVPFLSGKPKLTAEYVVQLPLFQDPTTTKTKLLTAAQSEFFALNDHQFLVLARDSSAGFTNTNPTSVYRHIDLIDISAATNLANSNYDNPGVSAAPLGVLNSAITPVTYQSFIDINDNTQLNRFGLHNGLPNDSNNLYEKWESIGIVSALDPKTPNDYFLFVGSDNDFITQDGHMVGKPYADASGANVDTLVLVYRVTLPTYVPQKPTAISKLIDLLPRQ